ncbi:hypothetical protein LCGC14_0277810 [marine sediment metagenome]|uniref:Uncharacterized protein n=1 Tax=marine sediment metagenome TaxID=412755 RepID=A0A0F9UDL1_9ZZZZ
MNRDKKAIISNIKYIIFGIVIVLAMYFWIQLREAKAGHAQLQELLSDTINHFEVIVTDQGQEIYIQDQKVASLENAIAAGIIEKEDLKNKNLKQIDHIIKLENQIVFYEELIAEVDTPNIVTVDSVDCPDIAEGTYLKVPSTFTYSSEWISLNGIVYGATVGILDLTIKQESTIFLGYQKTGLFKPLRPVVTIEDANPYVRTVKMHNVTIQNKPPFYKRPWWHRLEGAIIMLGTQAILNYRK